MTLQLAQLLGGPLDGREVEVPERVRDIVLADAKGRLHRYTQGRMPRRRNGKRMFHWDGHKNKESRE